MDNKDKIINICREIKNKNKCNNCGGDFNNYTCRYCCNDNLDLKNLIEELEHSITTIENVDNDILKSLFSVKNLNISFVNDFLNKYDFDGRIFKDWYSDILSNIDILGKFHYSCIIYFLDNNLFLENNKNEYINLLMKKLLTDKLDVSVDEILILIKNFVEMFMKLKVKNPSCVFEKLDDGVLGLSSLWNYIYLDKDKIINIINEKDYVQLLELIFHECTHTYQWFMLSSNNEISYFNLLMAKERLIETKCSSYYVDNYYKHSSEVHARLCGAFLTKQYLRQLELKMIDDIYFDNIINVENYILCDDTRVLNGIETNVDEVFSMFVDDVNCLDRFPVLNVQYKNNNGKLEKKAREEILYDYELYKNGDLKIEDKDNVINVLYDYLLGDCKSKGNSM